MNGKLAAIRRNALVHAGPVVEMHKTELISVDPNDPQAAVMEQAATLIEEGRLVAFPTETVYGVGADAMKAGAIEAIFAAKGRPADNPLIVHVAGPDMLASLVTDIPAAADKLIDRFWPGPLTLVLKRNPNVPEAVSAGLPTIAVRMPQGRIALELIRRSGAAIAAPSANLSGRPSPTRASDVWTDLNGKVDLILDGGPTLVGIESTVLDLTEWPPMVLRPGWISGAEIEAVLGEIRRPQGGEELRRSPGTRHRHYSPKARVLLVKKGTPEGLCELCSRFAGNDVGFIGYAKLGPVDQSIKQITFVNDAAAYSKSIYSALRDLDEAGVSVIVVQAPEESAATDAIMDRLSRAASEIIDMA